MYKGNKNRDGIISEKDMDIFIADECYKEMMTLKTLSKHFDIPLWTLRSWASKRVFPLYKVRGRIYVDLEEFRNWMIQFHNAQIGD